MVQPIDSTPTAIPVRRILAILVLSVAWAAPSCSSVAGPDFQDPDDPPPDTTQGTSDSFRVVGYHAWWSGDAWRRYDFSLVDAIFYFSLEVDRQGGIADTRGWPASWGELRAAAAAAGVPVVPTVSVLAADTFLAVFGAEEAASRLVEELVALAAQPGTQGLHMDFEMFEPVDSGTRDRVTDVIRRVRERTSALKPGFTLSAFALASDPGEAFDEVAIAKWVDYLVVQGYDFHWIAGETAGPVAPLEGWDGRNWHSVADRFAAAGIPSAKILFAVPYYGYEWPAESEAPGSRTRGKGVEITYAPVRPDLPSARDRAAQHGKRRDEASGSPYYVYQDSTGIRQGWFEDTQSLAAKYDFIRRNRMRGVAVFPMAYGDEQLDAVLTMARSGSR